MCYQQSLALDKNIGTSNWDKRTNLSNFGMIIINLWLSSKLTSDRNEKQEDYYQCLWKKW